ncbi:MAG: metallophosphoesterase [Pseudomonadota bacterium]
MTRLLAFSDLHAGRRAAQALRDATAPLDDAPVDLVLGAGDFCNMRQGLDAALALLLPLPCPVVLVPGNAESAEELETAAAAYETVTILHGTGCTVAGLRIFGLGYGVPVTPFGAWSCDLSEDAAARMLDACASADILLTHSPPKGIADRTSAGASVGSTAIRAAAERLQPRYLLCGHIHDSWGQHGRIGTCEVINLGPRPTLLEIAS